MRTRRERSRTRSSKRNAEDSHSPGIPMMAGRFAFWRYRQRRFRVRGIQLVWRTIPRPMRHLSAWTWTPCCRPIPPFACTCSGRAPRAGETGKSRLPARSHSSVRAAGLSATPSTSTRWARRGRDPRRHHRRHDRVRIGHRFGMGLFERLMQRSRNNFGQDTWRGQGNCSPMGVWGRCSSVASSTQLRISQGTAAGALKMRYRHSWRQRNWRTVLGREAPPPSSTTRPGAEKWLSRFSWVFFLSLVGAVVIGVIRNLAMKERNARAIDQAGGRARLDYPRHPRSDGAVDVTWPPIDLLVNAGDPMRSGQPRNRR